MSSTDQKVDTLPTTNPESTTMNQKADSPLEDFISHLLTSFQEDGAGYSEHFIKSLVLLDNLDEKQSELQKLVFSNVTEVNIPMGDDRLPYFKALSAGLLGNVKKLTFCHHPEDTEFLSHPTHSLAHGIQSLTNLTELRIDVIGDGLCMNQVFMKDTVFPNLEILDLSGLVLTEDDLDYFTTVTKSTFPSLTTLKLWASRKSTERTMDLISKWVDMLPKLINFELKHQLSTPLFLQLYSSTSNTSFVSKLTSFNLSSNKKFTTDVAKVLFDLPDFAKNTVLRELTFVRFTLNEELLTQFSTQLPNLSSLTSLGFLQCDITDEHIETICNSPYLNKLTQLDLEHESKITDEGLKLITECPNMSNLEKLFFSSRNQNISTATLRYISNSPYINNLTTMTSAKPRSGPLGQDDVINFLNSPKAKHLTHFAIEGGLKISSLKVLAQSTHLTNLTSLDLNSCDGLSPDEVNEWTKIFFNNPTFAKLTLLDLTACGLTDLSIKYLAESPYMGNLKSLFLRCLDHVTHTGYEYLANTACITNLEELNLSSSNGFDHEALSLFKNAPYILVNVARFSLWGCPISEQDAELFENAKSGYFHGIVCI